MKLAIIEYIYLNFFELILGCHLFGILELERKSRILND